MRKQEEIQPRIPVNKPFPDGPIVPNVPKPDTKNLIERMKRIDPSLSKKYKQRSGQ